MSNNCKIITRVCFDKNHFLIEEQMCLIIAYDPFFFQILLIHEDIAFIKYVEITTLEKTTSYLHNELIEIYILFIDEDLSKYIIFY